MLNLSHCRAFAWIKKIKNFTGELKRNDNFHYQSEEQTERFLNSMLFIIVFALIMEIIIAAAILYIHLHRK